MNSYFNRYIPSSPARAGAPVPSGGHISSRAVNPAGALAPPALYVHKRDEANSADVLLALLLRNKTLIAVCVLVGVLISTLFLMRPQSAHEAMARLEFCPYAEPHISGPEGNRYAHQRSSAFSNHLHMVTTDAFLRRAAAVIGNGMTAEDLRENLSVRGGESDGYKNDLIEIRIRHHDPQQAIIVVNTIVGEYLKYNEEVKAQERPRILATLAAQIRLAEQELHKKETELSHFKQANRMVDLSSRMDIAYHEATARDEVLNNIQLELAETRSRLDVLRGHVGRQSRLVLGSVTEENTVARRLADLRLERVSARAVYGEQHPRVRMLEEQIEALSSSIRKTDPLERGTETVVSNPLREALQREMAELSSRERALEKQSEAGAATRARTSTEAVKLAGIEQEYNELEREASRLLQTLLDLQYVLDVKTEAESPERFPIALFDLAYASEETGKQSRGGTMFAGISAGLLFGFLLAHLLEKLDRRIKNAHQVEGRLGVPMLGMIPFVEPEDDWVRRCSEGGRTIDDFFERLAVNLTTAANGARSIMICSGQPGDGKSTVAANLAISIARNGRHVILVDANMRTPGLHQMFGIARENGLSDFLSQGADMRYLLKRTACPLLRVVSAGGPVSMPVELLGSGLLRELTFELRRQADIVIYDTPALQAVSDALALASHVEGCVLVGKIRSTPMIALKGAKAQLASVGCPTFGVALNAVSVSRDYVPFVYGFYSYGYAYDYEAERSSGPLRKLGLRVEKKIREGVRKPPVASVDAPTGHAGATN